MHFSWFMHLFIFVLFSLFLSGKTQDVYDDNEENELTTTLSIFHDLTEESEDYDEKEKTIETTTTPIKKTTKHHVHFHDDDAEYYDHEDEIEDEKVSLTTPIETTLSSSSKIRLTTRIITETTTSENEVSRTRSTWPFSTVLYDFDRQALFTTTIDPEKLAAYLTKTNRDRLLLKIFTITVIIGMFSLAVVLITIHMVRKTRRYDGYRQPINTSSNEQSKHLNNIHKNKILI